MFGLNPRPRERRTVAIGIAVSAIALIVAYGAVPYGRRWCAREEVVAAQADRLERLRGLIQGEARLTEMLRARSGSLDAGEQRLLAGRTPALAASGLQSLLQGFADQSQVTVSQLDVTGAPDTSGATPTIPATVSAVGDIYGITDMLSLIQHGSVLLDINELNVRPNPALKGDLLQLTVSLRAPFVGS